MISKIILPILCAIIFLFAASNQACICGEQERAQSSTRIAQILSAPIQDLCPDCGHSRACHAGHFHPATTSGADSPVSFSDPDVVPALIAARAHTAISQQSLIAAHWFRGPPAHWRPQSLVNRQVLQI